MYIDSSKLLDQLFKAADVVGDIIKDPKAVRILNLIKNSSVELSLKEIRELLAYSYINKILFMFIYYGPLRKTPLYSKLLKQRMHFLKNMIVINNIIAGTDVNYVIFKTYRPVPGTPVDIDIIVSEKNDAYVAINALKKRFSVEIWDEDAYSIGIRVPQLGEFIDFYIKPHVADMVYLDADPFLVYKMDLYINEHGMETYIPVPIPELEFCAILGHSIIKERLLTLNDVLSLITYYMLSSRQRMLNFVSSQKLGAAFDILARISSFTFPKKIRLRDAIAGISARLFKKDTLHSSPYFIYRLQSRLKRAVERSRRITYVRGLNR